MSEYWEITMQEILSEHDISVCGDVLMQIARSVEICASVQSEYSAPVSGISEVESLKEEIKRLKNRRACTACGGHGGSSIAVGSSHSSWSDCRHCGGSGMIN